jgi:hypothetical protein
LDNGSAKLVYRDLTPTDYVGYGWIVDAAFLWLPEKPDNGVVTFERSYNSAEGYNTKSIDMGSHVEGWGSLTSGRYAHAEGEENKALGINSHAEGYNG